MIGKGDFVKAVAPCKFTCMECLRDVEKDAECWESRRYGRCQKRVCSQGCVETFDYHFWSGEAHLREAEERTKNCNLDTRCESQRLREMREDHEREEKPAV